ncbi:MAG: hypothetical protein RLZZ467_1055 [Gemmatimonadota bacterium]|jgi:uncharacterized protein (DUF1330 family)
MSDHVQPDHVQPDLATIRAVVDPADPSPVVMLNLNRYRERAEYPEGWTGADPDVSGREAYLRYGIVAFQAITAAGGAILWSTDAREVVIGCDHEDYDEVVAVWYPSRAAFLSLETFPGYMEALEHRGAAVAQAAIIACDASPTRELTTPFT